MKKPGGARVDDHVALVDVVARLALHLLLLLLFLGCLLVLALACRLCLLLRLRGRALSEAAGLASTQSLLASAGAKPRPPRKAATTAAAVAATVRRGALALTAAPTAAESAAAKTAASNIGRKAQSQPDHNDPAESTVASSRKSHQSQQRVVNVDAGPDLGRVAHGLRHPSGERHHPGPEQRSSTRTLSCTLEDEHLASELTCEPTLFVRGDRNVPEGVADVEDHEVKASFRLRHCSTRLQFEGVPHCVKDQW